MKSRHGLYAGLPNASRIYRDRIAPIAEQATRVLDIGCGRMRLLEKLSTSGMRVGVDLVRLTPPPGVSGVNADVVALPFVDNTFDLVLCTSVLEHLTAPAAMFRDVARVLRPGGNFVILTPNRWDYVSLISTVVPNRWHPVLVNTITGRDPDDTFPTYYRANSRRAIMQHVAAAGMRVIECTYLREHPHYLQRNRFLYAIGTLLEQGVQRPFQWVRPWLLVVTRNPTERDQKG